MPLPVLRILPTWSSLLDDRACIRDDLDADALVLVAGAPLIPALAALPLPGAIRAALQRAAEVDAALARGTDAPLVLPLAEAPGGRVVLATLPDLTHEAEDVRSVADAVGHALRRAGRAGARRPLLCVEPPEEDRYRHARHVAALAALAATWEPSRDAKATSVHRHDERALPGIECVWVVGADEAQDEALAAIEAGRRLCRELVVADPEAGAPLAFASRCMDELGPLGVACTLEEDVSAYPLLAAVARASMSVPRHRPCVLTLVLESQGPAERTLFVAGKGVTYDTGGADLKTDGSMAGMSRDKGGAAAAAGLMLALARMRPRGLRVVTRLGLVRNSIGVDAFVSDEVIRARSGVRVRIGNTDAEGRLVLADLLASAREEAMSAPAPQVLSLATLTGHAYRAFGPLIAAIENQASRERGFLAGLQQVGEHWGEPLEYTRPRREDYAYLSPKTSLADVLSSNRLATVNTPRGHQGPYAFLDVASGLHGSGVPFAHLDISGAVVDPPDWQAGRPTGTPIASLVRYWVGERQE